jgi:hypothetical protein
MIQIPTVFIVGAGASAEYGFPLGGALVKRIVFNMRKEGTALRQALARVGVSLRDVEEFCIRLQDSDSDSIDVFLENNREEFVRIGKAAIACVILLAEEECARGHRLVADPPADNWLKYVWNIARGGCSVATLAENRLGFISFNYDRVLETYLDGVMRSTFNLEAAEGSALRAKAFPIVHLHGQVSGVSFGEIEGAFADDHLGLLASGIRVVHDEVPTNDPAFESAFNMISSARRICCLGFGFHPTNIRRLRLHDIMSPDARFHGSTFGMGEAQIGQALNALNLQIERIRPHLKCEAFLRECVDLT